MLSVLDKPGGGWRLIPSGGMVATRGPVPGAQWREHPYWFAGLPTTSGPRSGRRTDLDVEAGALGSLAITRGS
jgi:hypothetical protein